MAINTREIIQTGECRKRAIDRVATLHPKAKACPVEVEVFSVGAIVSVSATGTDAPYVQLFLDALVQEYLNYDREMFGRLITDTLNSMTEELLRAENRLSEAAKRKEEEAADLPILEAETEALLSKLQELTKAKIDGTVPAAEADAKLVNLKSSIESAAKIVREKREIWDEYEWVKKFHDEKNEKLETTAQLIANTSARSFELAVLEKASPAMLLRR